MSVPYEYPFVQSEIGPRLRIVGGEQETRENSFKAVNDACVKIRAQKNTNWGLLKKTGGANAFGYAADIWLYKFGDGTAQVVDVVGNSEGSGGSPPVTAWAEKDFRQESEWSEPMPVFEPDDGGESGGGESGGGDSSELAVRVTALEEIVTAQGVEIDDLTTRVAAIERTLQGGLRAHGPVNLPCVLESLTKLRAKGDIDVPITTGQVSGAQRTAPPADDDDDGLTVATLKKVLK